MNEHIKSLISAYVNEVITPAQFEELERALQTDATVRERYLHELSIHAALEDLALAEAEQTSRLTPSAATAAEDLHRNKLTPRAVVKTDIRHTDNTRSLPLASWAIAAVAVVALLITVIFMRLREEPIIAMITDLGGSLQWTGNGGQVSLDLKAGEHLHGGTLELPSADSWVEIEFLDGSTVTISGPSSLTISERERKELYLRSGRLSANVEPQAAGKPMLIHTPTADLEVLGTQLNVNAEAASTALTVNKGLVRLTRAADEKVVEVPADHQVVASVDRSAELIATRRPGTQDSWKSRLAEGISYGALSWPRGSHQPGVRAEPILWRGCERNQHEPVLLFLAALPVSHSEQPPVELRAGSKLRIQGRMESPKNLLIGLTTHHLKGGFAGKHHAWRPADTFLSDEGTFDLEVRIEEFVPERPQHPKSVIGLTLHDWWCLTIHEDAGLTITSVELIPAEIPQD